MKRSLLLIAPLIIATHLYAQLAPVPTFWDCSGNIPDGWIQVQTGTPGNLFYTSPDLYTSAPSSARLDNTGEYIQINIDDEPGLVSYNIKGSVGSGNWSGTFKTQWSINGNTWVDMRTITSLPSGSAPFLSLVDTPSALARYIRFFFSNKVSGSNVALDDIRINAPVPGPKQEIQVSFNNQKVTSGGAIWFNSPVGTPTVIAISVQNLGSDSVLTLGSGVFGGGISGDYDLLSVPQSVNPKSSADIRIRFTPSGSGTRQTIFTFSNNDADENPFTIILNGVGGNLATEPSANPTSINFSNIRAYSLRVGVKGNTADGYLVLRKLGSPVTDAPVDGKTYGKGEGIGASKVFYIGKDTSFLVQETHANLTYHFAVFPFNGIGAFTNYKQNSPLTASVTSANGKPSPTYYSGIDTSSPNFVNNLSALINNHKQIFYSNFKPTILDNFYARDTVAGGFTKVVNCEYSGQFVLYNPPFDFTAQNLSREHAFASSWMPTFGQPAHQDRYAYTDLFNLRLVNQNEVNSPRSNNTFADLKNQTSSFLLAKFGTDENGKPAFEPRDGIKGDVARSLMYMMVAYNRQPNKANNQPDAINSWALDSLVIPGIFPNPDEILSTRQKQAVLKKWHFQDLPDAEEIARNQYVFDQQNNRNPFIDFPDWACYIDFNKMAYIPKGCNATSIKEDNIKLNDITVLPNPFSDKFSLFAEAAANSVVQLLLLNVHGQVVYRAQENFIPGTNFVEINATHLPAGPYLLQLVTNNETYSKKLLKD
ncbi:MAG: endonuclease [Chitinophagales bacterium]|nr:endonuclease [Chitinophagales bacterium]MDW8272768.1 endonuclease [Chitinophagales bacterium]